MPLTAQDLDQIMRRSRQSTDGDLEVTERDSVWRGNEWLAEFLRPADAEAFAYARRDILALIDEVSWLQTLLGNIYRDWQAGILPPIPSNAHPYPLMKVVEYLLLSRGISPDTPPAGDGAPPPPEGYKTGQDIVM